MYSCILCNQTLASNTTPMNINGMYYSILLKIYTYLKALVSKDHSTHMDPKYEFDSVHGFFFKVILYFLRTCTSFIPKCRFGELILPLKIFEW